MTKTLLKNTFLEIWNTKARFISILAIVALGVGFFAGIKATSPSMLNMAENYYKDTNLMDFRLVSTVGFDSEDIDSVRALEGVADVMPSYFMDVIINYGNVGNAVRIISVPTEYGDSRLLNTLTLKEGRMPEKAGEILVDCGSIGGSAPSVGDKVKIEPTAGSAVVGDILNTFEYTVVGVVQSPLYISYERGLTTVGNGKLSAFMYVLPENFKVEKYTELYVKTRYSQGDIAPYSDEYKEYIEDLKGKLEDIAAERCGVFETNVTGKAQKEIDDGWAEYNAQKENADKELESSKEQLIQAQSEYDSEIASTQDLMNSAQSQIDSGESRLNTSLEEYLRQISEGESELSASIEKLKSAKELYAQAEAEFNEKIRSAQNEIDQAYEKYKNSSDIFYDRLKPFLLYNIGLTENGLNYVNSKISPLEEKLRECETSSPDEAAEIAKIKGELRFLYASRDTLNYVLDKLNYALYTAEETLNQTRLSIELAQNRLNEEKTSGQLKLQQALTEIQQGEEKYIQGKNQLETAKIQGEEKLKSAREQLESAKTELENAKAEFESKKASGQLQINSGWEQYRSALQTAEEKLKTAREQLESAQRELDSVTEPQWYVFTRDDNPGYSGFIENTNRVDAVAAVFPTFFLLVAVLVCLTTMTRLIEEKRTEIGTLKALGYSGGAIIGKFLIYSTLAGVIGCTLGVLAGINTLPFIIYNAYKMMYTMSEITLVVDKLSIVLGIIAALMCTTIVSVVVCRRTLSRNPAVLMRTKAPKPGKRILLERIKPLWSRLGFTSKVTARNLFRYKSRLFMTVLGVAGCTALIVAAFGLLNSFDALTNKQFNDIYKYDAVVIPGTEGGNDQLNDLSAFAYADDDVDVSMLAKQSSVTVKTDRAVKNSSTYLLVPGKLSEFNDLFSLHTRIGAEPLPLTDDGAVITEKMAVELCVSAGDTVTVVLDGEEKSVKVKGVCENYIYNYVYLTPEYYKEIFEKPLNFNSMFLKLSDDVSENSVGSRYLRRDDVTAVTFTSSGINDFQKMLNSMNMIVVVLIVCAGALAFVVLYNLTNINLEERTREIATLKVLGFYNRETAGYIYRESIILTLLGILAGLLMGVVLTGFVVTTIEVDNVMFGREIFVSTYLYASGLTLLFIALVNLFMYRKMKNIDMVESLKSIE